MPLFRHYSNENWTHMLHRLHCILQLRLLFISIYRLFFLPLFHSLSPPNHSHNSLTFSLSPEILSRNCGLHELKATRSADANKLSAFFHSPFIAFKSPDDKLVTFVVIVVVVVVARFIYAQVNWHSILQRLFGGNVLQSNQFRFLIECKLLLCGWVRSRFGRTISSFIGHQNLSRYNFFFFVAKTFFFCILGFLVIFVVVDCIFAIYRKISWLSHSSKTRL